MQIKALLQNTNAYKIIKADKLKGTLSHAILLVCQDEIMLETYLKFFAKTLMCNNGEPCLNCRACNLIDKKAYSDAIFYPTNKKIVVADIDDLIEKSYLKPLENSNKIFILNNAHEMNAQCQNKLLKTLENPPENTYILLGATTTNTLLQTVLSRVKKLEIMPFKDEEIIDFLKGQCEDLEKLKNAVKLSLGKLGEALKQYETGGINDVYNLAVNVLTKLNSSRQIAEFSASVNGEILKDFISVTASLLNDALAYKSGKTVHDKNVEIIAKKYSYGALIYASDKLREAEKAINFNGNATAVKDALLFGILEGNYKWSK